MKYRSAKNRTIDIPDGLSPAQIKQIKADADRGYGTLAAQNAAKWSKGINKNPNVTTQPVDNSKTINDNINKDGSIKDPNDLNNQAPKVFDPNDPYYQNLYKTTYQNNYDLATQGLDKRQARDLEDAKQEAANRGIPFDPGNRESAYGKAVGGVNDRYDQLYQTANEQAYNAANAQYDTQGGLANQGHSAFMQGVLGISQADATAIQNGTASLAVQNDYKAKMAAIAKSGSGGGRSGKASGSSGPIIGGDASGWSI